jgi:hypothetical protein
MVHNNTWQPIETAPREDASILARCLEDYPQGVYYVEEYDAWRSLVTNRFVCPTGWIPLPETESN